MRSPFLCFIAGLMAFCALTVAAAQVPTMPPLKTYHLDVPVVRGGQALATIITRTDEEAVTRGAWLADQIEKATGVRVPTATELVEGGPPNTIIIGKFDDPALQYLYRNHFILTDARFPGSGGYVIRTVHDPFGDGRSVVFLGGSDAAGQQRSVEAFAATIAQGAELVVPHMVQVMSPGPSAARLTPERIDAAVQRCEGSQFRNAASIICGAAAAYHRGGDPGQAEVFRQGVAHVARLVAEMAKVPDTRGIFTLPVVWDQIEESPVFSDEDRERITRFVWEYANKCPGANQTVEVAPTPHGNSWNSRANWWAAAYFRRYYDVDVAGLEAWSDNWFEANIRSWKPSEDCPGYGSITWYDLMCYMLERPRYQEYIDSGNLRKMADYAMMITNNLGYLSGFGDISSFSTGSHVPGLLLIAGWLEQDGRYLWFSDRMPGPSGSEYMGKHYYVDNIEPTPPEDILGVKAFELPDWVYENRSRVLGAASADVTAVLDTQPVPPYEACFDKISYRAGFEPEDEYLLLGGISHGYHAHPDGNSIIGYTDNGKYWLFDNGYFVPDTIEHNTICIFRNGLFEPVPRLTGLQASADFAPMGMTRTQCAGYNGVDWRRNILWNKGKYFAVLDELEALEDSDFNFQCIWRTIGDIDLKQDRMLVEQAGERFCLINPSMAAMKLAETMPVSAGRRALVQTTPAQLQTGQRTVLLNLFYSPDTEGWPYDAVRAADNAMLVREPEGHAFITAGEFEHDQLSTDAHLAYLSPRGCRLLEATALKWDGDILQSDLPISADVDWQSGQVTITNQAPAKVAIEGIAGITTLEPGTHSLKLATHAMVQARETALGQLFDGLAAKREPRAALDDQQMATMLKPLWGADHAVTVTNTILRAVGQEGTEAEPNLAREGTASQWEPASAGARAASASDGSMETYAAVTSAASHATELPKDLGIEWSSPRTVSQVRVYHYDNNYRPAFDGQDLQQWDGEQWVSIDDEVTGEDTPNWVHTFEPVTTTRIRLLITAFDTMRTAIREFEVYARPVDEVDVQTVQTRVPSHIATWDMDGDGAEEVAVAVGSTVMLYGGSGQLLWARDVGKGILALDAGDLGGPAVVASDTAHRMHCLTADGELAWVITCAADQYTPDVEPFSGYFTVLRIGDIDGDGDGEIVAGNSNWFAYAFDHEGNQLWGSLNWAHPALSIALGDLKGDGKLAALIGTRYNDAGLFQWDGTKIGGLGMGYHSCPCATDLADLDGDGVMELIGGSRIGGVRVNAFEGGATLWALDMGAEVRVVKAADLTGDGLPEVLAASRNCYVLCLDEAGEIIWSRNMGDAVAHLVTGDVDGDGALEVIVGVEDGNVHVLAADGTPLNVLPTGGAITEVAVADIDGDGGLEILAGSRDGRLYAAKMD